MGGGGGKGGGGAPVDNSVRTQELANENAAAQRAWDAEQAALTRQAQQQAAAEQRQYETSLRAEQLAREQAQEQQRLERYTSGLTTAQQNAQQRGSTLLQQRGLEGDEYNNIIQQAILGASQSVPYLADNPGAYFADSIFDQALNQYQSGQRDQYTRGVDQFFRPGFDSVAFADTADDTILADILNSQRGDATRAIEMARSRGNLDSTGYNAAMSELDRMFNAGMSTAQTLGGGVLSNYRQQLKDIGGEARSAASGYTLGGNFDLGDYTNRYESTLGDLQGRLAGDITSALSGQNFFDLGDILTRGGNAQGPINPRTTLPSLLAERERVRDSERGQNTGSAGTF